MQTIILNGTSLNINGIDHTLNTDFYKIVDNFCIHLSLDANNNIRLFYCNLTTVNGNVAQNSDVLLFLFGFTI